MWTKVIFSALFIFALSAPVFSQGNPTELTLKKSIELALEHNLGLKIARLQLEETELDLRKAEAAFKPQADLSVSPLQWEGDEDLLEYEPEAHLTAILRTPAGTSYSFSVDGQLGEDDAMQTSWSANISQQIIPRPSLDSFSLSLVKSRITLEVAKLRFEEEVSELKLEVMTGFYAILRQKKECELKQLSLQHAEESLRIARDKLQRGMASDLDILDTEATLIGAEEALFRAKSALSQYRMNFKELVGISLQEDIIVIANPPGDFHSLGVSLEEAQAEALENHPQIQEQNLQIKVYELDLARTKAQSFASLNWSKHLTGRIQ